MSQSYFLLLILYLSSSLDNVESNDDSQVAGHHPHFDRAVMRSRRKSVSFAVYKVNADTMQFEVEQKSVLLGNLSASSAPSTSPASLIQGIQFKGQTPKFS